MDILKSCVVSRPMRRFPFLLLLFVILITCCRNPYAATNRLYRQQARAFARTLKQRPVETINPGRHWVGTTNFNLRKPNLVVIHHTAQTSCEQTLNTFTQLPTQVSAHYLVCKDGTVHHLLNDYLRAWHGGVARWGNTTDVNSGSIGIELDNNGLEPFTAPQIESLLQLLDTLKTKYNIPPANFIGHSDIAPTRKVDPNVWFPWHQLADSGYGLWYDDTSVVTVPESFNSVQALRIIGYDVRDSSAAVAAFKRKWEQIDSSKILTTADRKVLYSLYQKYQ